MVGSWYIQSSWKPTAVLMTWAIKTKLRLNFYENISSLDNKFIAVKVQKTLYFEINGTVYISSL